MTAAPASSPAADPSAALAALREAVAAHGYDTILRLHAWEQAPRGLDASLRATLRHAAPASRDLVRLLYLGEVLPAARVEALLGGPSCAALHDAGLLVSRADGVAARYRLEVAGDHLLLVEWPEARAAGVYFGEDSDFLRSVLAPRRGAVCLDLCTGSGIQALRCAAVGARVDAVDLNPDAVALARLNAELNGLADRLRVYTGDLWAPLAPGARYDHVVANPPLVPVPETVPYPLCGHGGADGLGLVRRIFEGLTDRLTARGRCTLIGASTGTSERPAVLDELERTVADRMHVSLYLLSRASLRDWVSTLVATVRAVYRGGGAANTVLRARACYGPAFDETVVTTFLVVCDRGRRPAGCHVVDYSTVGRDSFWFVNRGRAATAAR